MSSVFTVSVAYYPLNARYVAPRKADAVLVVGIEYINM